MNKGSFSLNFLWWEQSVVRCKSKCFHSVFISFSLLIILLCLGFPLGFRIDGLIYISTLTHFCHWILREKY